LIRAIGSRRIKLYVTCGINRYTRRVNRQHHTLAAVRFCHFAKKFGPIEGRRAHGNFIGSGVHRFPHIINTADAAADTEGDKHFRGNPADNIKECRPAFVRRAYVKKGKLIGPVIIVAPGKFNRIARILNALELYSFNHPSIINIKTGDNTFCLHTSLLAWY
jgi:hypothetical protein